MPLVLTLSVHVCELQICKFAKSRRIRHILSLYTGVFADCRGHDLSIAHDSYHMLTRTTVHRDPMLLKGQRRRTMEEQMGGSPKALQQHLAGETSLLVVCPESRQHNFKAIRSEQEP